MKFVKGQPISFKFDKTTSQVEKQYDAYIQYYSSVEINHHLFSRRLCYNTFLNS